jgi:diaminohydroxyphosphoribosylaminopyrimidine deaminase / 5-amino-6-(5-phosphoribosylamino)uracil reductase
MAWKAYEVEAMERALALARKGRGAVEPNPMVGAVVVRGGKIIAEGYHKKFGGPHAEVWALEAAGKAARGAEVFVTLEPCSHFGKTPPCADALMGAGAKRVVAAMEDPDKRVSGKGFAKLKAAGIKAEVGLLGEEAARLNAPYVKLRTLGLPWVIAKYAMTADGRIAAASGESHWISCDASRRAVHRLRSVVDAIVVGVGTALVDDPLLTARPRGRRVAARVVLDSEARLPVASKLVATAAEAPLIVATSASAPRENIERLKEYCAEVIVCGKERVDVKALAEELGRRQMTNVLVEGGASVLGSFFGAQLVDEAMVFVAPKLVGAGVGAVEGWQAGGMAEALTLEELKVTRHGCDVMMSGRVKYPEGR